MELYQLENLVRELSDKIADLERTVENLVYEVSWKQDKDEKEFLAD